MDTIDVEQIVREYVDKTVHMSLGTASLNGKPWVCEVHFVYDDNLNLYFRSLPSRRHSQEIAANPSVAGNIVKQHELGEYPHAIYFEGSAQQVTADAERQRIFEIFRKRQNLKEAALEESATKDGHQFYRITVKNWYAFGKFGREGGQKDQLVWNGGKK
jgi:nitroimidazol reductase NimA-like FMN-containing flavoprotein (pyridoxamine 5'-phosphate oxidase superfamily)